jgi:hypothetical protein
MADIFQGFARSFDREGGVDRPSESARQCHPEYSGIEK